MVSVIIPVYNRFPLVNEMVKCILSQTFIDWELLLVDDGSTDGTYEKLQEFPHIDQRIKVIQRPANKKGAPVCRNIGLENAKGEYVIFFDSDDLVAPYCLEQRVCYMNSHSDVDAAVFPARHFKESVHETNGLLNGIQIFRDDLEEFIGVNLPYIVWNVIFRRKCLFEKHIIWDEQLLSLQDADFNIQCILKGIKISYANTVNVDYYARAENNNSVSAGIYKISRFDSHLHFVDKIFAVLPADTHRKYRMALYYRLVYIYILMSYNYSKEHVEKLIDLSEKYDCLSCFFKISIYINRFLIDRLKIGVRISNMLIFPYFSLHMRTCYKKRNKYNRLKLIK